MTTIGFIVSEIIRVKATQAADRQTKNRDYETSRKHKSDKSPHGLYYNTSLSYAQEVKSRRNHKPQIRFLIKLKFCDQIVGGHDQANFGYYFTLAFFFNKRDWLCFALSK